MRYYLCGEDIAGFNKSQSEPGCHQNGKKPLCFDFKNYKIHWDPRVEEYVNNLRIKDSKTRVVGNDHSQDDLLDDEDEPFFYSESEDTDKLELALSLLKIKSTSPLLKKQFVKSTNAQ